MQESNLYQLAYLSIATNSPSHEDLNLILNVSVENNKLHHITGFLMYVEKSFFQVIEGSQRAIDDLYQNLLNDERHTRVTKVLYGPIKRRRFADWRMAFLNYDKFQNVPVKGFSRFLLDFQSRGKTHLNAAESQTPYCQEYLSLHHMIDNMRNQLILSN